MIANKYISRASRLAVVVGVFCFALIAQLKAQLPDGSVAPDWTATDLDGNIWNLQELLDAGKTVVIQFSATWCGPCWNYHNTGILRDLYDAFGPNGSNDLMVFFIEGDATTSIDDLYGAGSSTVGDWTAGTIYPIIDDADGSIFDAYAGQYFPTIYTICPDGILVESGQSSFDAHLEMAFADCENPITGAVPILSYTGDVISCLDDWSALVNMTNIGSESMSTAFFSISINGVSQPGVEWTGNLEAGASTQVELGSYTAAGDIDIEISSVNGGLWSSEIATSVVVSSNTTPFIKVSVLTDNWGEETGWTLKDGNGEIIHETLEGTLGDQTSYEWWFQLESDACYELKFTDAYGDGLHGSQWGGGAVNGAIEVSYYPAMNLDETFLIANAFNYDGSTNFDELATGIATTLSGSLEGCIDTSACNFDPWATIEDGSCTYPGCMDLSAENYDPDAGCDSGECVYFAPTCEYVGSADWANMPSGLSEAEGTLMLGDYGSVQAVFNAAEVIGNNGTFFQVDSIVMTSVAGMPDGISMIASGTSWLPGTQECITFEGVPYEAGVFEVDLAYNVYVDVFGSSILANSAISTITLVVGDNPGGIAGCTYPTASNYNAVANIDNGACEWLGCTDASATNFSQFATAEDGSCVYGTSLCASDANQDGTVNTSDLLNLLSEFGLQCD